MNALAMVAIELIPATIFATVVAWFLSVFFPRPKPSIFHAVFALLTAWIVSVICCCDHRTARVSAPTAPNRTVRVRLLYQPSTYSRQLGKLSVGIELDWKCPHRSIGIDGQTSLRGERLRHFKRLEYQFRLAAIFGV